MRLLIRLGVFVVGVLLVALGIATYKAVQGNDGGPNKPAAQSQDSPPSTHAAPSQDTPTTTRATRTTQPGAPGTNAAVGDCITADMDNPTIVNCSSSSAAFKVLEKHDDTTDTEVCDTDAVKNAGGVAGFYWHGDGKGLLCVGVTPHTTLKQLQAVPGLETATQDDLTSIQAKARNATTGQPPSP